MYTDSYAYIYTFIIMREHTHTHPEYIQRVLKCDVHVSTGRAP